MWRKLLVESVLIVWYNIYSIIKVDDVKMIKKEA